MRGASPSRSPAEGSCSPGRFAVLVLPWAALCASDEAARNGQRLNFMCEIAHAGTTKCRTPCRCRRRWLRPRTRLLLRRAASPLGVLVAAAGRRVFAGSATPTPKHGRNMGDAEPTPLAACRDALTEWTERLRQKGRAIPLRGQEQPRDGFPPGGGGPRQVPPTLPSLRRPSAAHRPPGERNQLLRHLPDRRTAPGGPLPLAPAQGHLPEANRGFGIGRGRGFM